MSLCLLYEWKWNPSCCLSRRRLVVFPCQSFIFAQQKCLGGFGRLSLCCLVPSVVLFHTLQVLRQFDSVVS